MRIYKLQDLNENMSKIKSKNWEKFIIYISADKYGSFVGKDSDLRQFNSAMGQIKTVTGNLEIDFRDNFFKDDNLQGIIEIISNNPNMQGLSILMTSNFLTDVGVSRIFHAVGKANNLRTLNVNFNW